MLRKIIYGLVAVALIALCYVGYTRYRQGRDMTSGEVRRGPAEPADSFGTEASVPQPESTTRSTVHVGSPPPGGVEATQGAAAPASAPVSDSMTPNPPNGMAYAGSGRFQVYRQGNITYRINTDTGHSCVLYATNEEWRKPQVYSQGCGNTTAQ